MTQYLDDIVENQEDDDFLLQKENDLIYAAASIGAEVFSREYPKGSYVVKYKGEACEVQDYFAVDYDDALEYVQRLISHE